MIDIDIIAREGANFYRYRIANVQAYQTVYGPRRVGRAVYIPIFRSIIFST